LIGHHKEAMNKSRLEAFSDGIFAVVITLLVLDIKLAPDVSYEMLPSALHALLPKLLSYVLSFSVVGVYWAFHHFSLSQLRRVDGTLVFLNLLLMLLVTFMPFPTILLGEYPMTPIPLVIYGASLVASNLIGFIWVVHLHRHPELLAKPPAKSYLAKQLPIYLLVNIPYVAAMIIAFFLPVASYGIYIAVLIGVARYVWKQSTRLSANGPTS
jgi:uncharacterized membrane protein